MQTLRNIISHYIRYVTFLLVAFLLAVILCLQIAHEQRQARETAGETFYQIGQLLERNQEELAETKAAYRQTCLHNAEAIAYMIEDNPSVLDSVEELQRIAKMMKPIFSIPRDGFMRAPTRNIMIIPLIPESR